VEEHRRGFRFDGAVALDRVVSGMASFPTFVASPTGTARALDAEITLAWDVAA